ncbi:hypothetical protein RCC89_15760 [Cytophagaceae bacterium ABcell3]|nr:hypothetical protein RCC89_15760 [Cytophagaceae bacterium ABcell3]
MQPFKLSINYQAEDLQKAFETHFFTFHPHRTRLMLYLALAMIALGIVLEFVYANGDSFTAHFLLIYGTFVLFYYIWKTKSMGKRLYKKLPEYQAPIVYEVSDQGLSIETHKGAVEHDWKDMNRALVKDDIILVYPNDSGFHIFMKKHLKGEEFAKLKGLVEKKVPK